VTTSQNATSLPTAEKRNKALHQKGRVAISPAHLAQRWGKCRQTIYNLITAGELHSFKVGNSVLIPHSEIERIERGGT
jgi:excisionase family DNA binding protein